MNNNGTIQKKRSEELHIQDPPSTDINLLNTKVTAKNKADKIPREMAMDLFDFIIYCDIIEYDTYGEQRCYQCKLFRSVVY